MTYRTKDGNIKESAIREAQEVIEAVIAELDVPSIEFYRDGNHCYISDGDVYGFRSLVNLYVQRLHKLNGTQAPLF